MSRRRVLLSAFACDPYRGSEDAVGWGWARAISGTHEGHVLTAEFQREPIERWRAEHPGAEDGLTFHFVPPRWFHYQPSARWKRIEATSLKPLMNLAYAHWLRDAARLAAALDAQYDFDLIHLVTYVGYRFPGRYWALGKPFVWGPIGGLENTPWRLLPGIGLSGAIYHGVRNTINFLQRRMLPSARRAMGAADARIAATRGIQRQIQSAYRQDSTVITEVALPDSIAESATSRPDGAPLRIAWSGLHLPRKGLPFLLRALARLGGAVDWELVVLGQGACTQPWQALAQQLGVGERIRWTGWVERTAALAELRSAHVFVITSIEDLTSTVLVEALGQGLPVVCPDLCGFPDVVTADCGVVVPADDSETLVVGLSGALERLAADEALRVRLAEGARTRAGDYTWDEKALQIEQVYQRVFRKAEVKAAAPARSL